MTEKPNTALVEQAATDQAASILEIISRAASDPAVDISKMEKLMQMHERSLDRFAERDFDVAMTAAQSEIEPVRTDMQNSQTGSKYASFVALDRPLRPIYTKHGFSISYNTGDASEPGHIRIFAHVAHSAGGKREYHVDMPADGKGAKGGDVMTKTHAVGSAMTYGQRYLLKLIFNIAVGDDDDGNMAGNEPVSADQLVHLIAMTDEVKADTRKFCEWLGVDALAAIPAKRYGEAVRALEQHKMKTDAGSAT